MTVLKLSRSGKAVLVVDDEGRVFVSSVAFVRGLLDGRAKLGFVRFARLPGMVSPSRFGPSSVFNPEGRGVDVAAPSLRDDAFVKKGVDGVLIEDFDEW